MHYKNGRIACNGDKVVLINEYNKTAQVGVLYDAKAGNDFCNGKLATFSILDLCPNLKECLHMDDVLGALTLEVPNTSVPSEATIDYTPVSPDLAVK